MPNTRIQYDISWTAIFKIAATVLGIWFLWVIRDIVALFFIVLVLVAAFSPIIDRWSKKINRLLAISLLFLSMLIFFALVGWVIIPPIILQIQNLATSLPRLTEKILPLFGAWQEMVHLSSQTLSSLASQLESFSNSVYTTTVGFFGGLVALFTILILTFYLLVEEHGARKFIRDHLPLDNREIFVSIAQKIGSKMGAWLRGQIVLALAIGLIDFIGLLILGVPFALTLAVWAGVTEIIPYIGPILGAIPAVIIGFSISPLIGLLVLIFYIVVQQLEAHFLVPKVMQKAVGLSPVVIILALLVGGKLAGILGIILAVPAAAAIAVLIQELPQLKKSNFN